MSQVSARQVRTARRSDTTSQAEPLLDAGRLARLAPDRSADVPLFWQQWKLYSHALTAVAEAVPARAAEALGT